MYGNVTGLTLLEVSADTTPFILNACLWYGTVLAHKTSFPCIHLTLLVVVVSKVCA